MSYHYLLDLALILLSTKLLGIATGKFQMPRVVGALLAGLDIGINYIVDEEEEKVVAEYSVRDCVPFPAERTGRHRDFVHRRNGHRPA